MPDCATENCMVLLVQLVAPSTDPESMQKKKKKKVLVNEEEKVRPLDVMGRF